MKTNKENFPVTPKSSHNFKGELILTKKKMRHENKMQNMKKLYDFFK